MILVTRWRATTARKAKSIAELGPRALTSTNDATVFLIVPTEAMKEAAVSYSLLLLLFFMLLFAEKK